jgi:hypothetical protein
VEGGLCGLWGVSETGVPGGLRGDWVDWVMRVWYLGSAGDGVGTLGRGCLI